MNRELNQEVEKLKFTFETFSVLVFIRKHLKPLAIITSIGAIISIIVSLTIENKYKSTVILFPVASGSISQTLLTENLTAKNILQFGEEEQAEQMLQVLNSDEIRNRIIEKYDLMNHYEIEADAKFKYTTLSQEFNSNISFRRTEFMSVEIKVLDKDPQMAADIANDIANLLDSAMSRMQKERALKALQLVEEEYNIVKNNMQKLEDSLNVLRALGIYHYDAQAEVYSDVYASAIAENKTKPEHLQILKDQLDLLGKYGGAFVTIRDLLFNEKRQAGILKAKYMEAKVDVEQDLPYKFVVNSAYKAERKSYPIRWLIVSISTISTALFALILLVFIEYYRSLTSSKS